MLDGVKALQELGWPIAVVLAWVVGELGHRWTGLPRICLYGMVGFALGPAQAGLLPADTGGTVMLLANVAFGLILFEFGYRINLNWLRNNPWLAASGLLESGLTFACVLLLAYVWGLPTLTGLLLASLAMSTSPASIMRVINEQRSSGQVTERLVHLTGLNCVLAVFTFKVIVGVWTFQSSGSLLQASLNSGVLLAASAALGALFGIGVPALLRRTGNVSRDATVAFAIAVMLVVAVAHAFKLSPVLAALTFGLMARHRRIAFSATQRNFGTLGDVLTVVLFMFVASTLEWQRVWQGMGLALALIAVRAAAKVAGVTAFARLSGVTPRKGMLTGLAMTPISVFVILLLEQARYLGVDLVDQLAALAATTLLLELAGPVVTQRALMWARETHEPAEH
ncbi:MAG: cation:proton antiporter [Roseateles sp.]|uniref:cation:proton antiporter n=1 Tax=Roseateles sp. TaxID=1971397 RepID=UPI00403738E4